MPNLRDLVRSTRGKMFLFKGSPGTGKSPALASFPNIYIFDFDRRISSLAKMFPHKKDIYYDTFISYPKYAEKLEELTNNCPYETIAIDSLTNLIELTMSYFISLRGGGTRNIQESPKEKVAVKSKGIIPMLMIDDYSAETRAISELLINLKYLAETKNVNIIVTSHVITTTTTNIKTGNQTIEKFLLTYGKKATGKIPTLFDEIYHFTTQSALVVGEDTAYIVNTDNTGDDFARSSFWMPKEINWTNKNFYQEISQYFELEKESPMDITVRVNEHGLLDVPDTPLSDPLVENEE